MIPASMPEASSSLEFGNGFVVKRFGDPGDFAREYQIYRLGLGMTPRLLDFCPDKWIKTERAAGIPYLDAELGPDGMDLLAKTIGCFHQATLLNGNCLCHWDNQPRNILYSNGIFTLIDFSDSRLASPAADITHLMLFWAAEWSYRTLRERSERFLVSYRSLISLAADAWDQAFSESVKRFDLRREQHGKRSSRQELSTLARNRQFLEELGTRIG